MADEKNTSNDTTVIIQSDDRGAIAVYRKKRHLIFTNFLGGLAWGLGTVVGATIVFALLLLFLNSLGGIPLIGHFISELAKSITSHTK